LVNSTFSVPDILPSDFILRFRTNSQGPESKYYLYDDIGTELFSRTTAMTPNTLFRDTFNLAPGCYSLVVEDTDDDGIDFWANNDGSGFCQIYRIDIPIALKVLEPDFGGSITYNFTVDYPLPSQPIEQNVEVDVFPNPVDDYFVIESDEIQNAQIQVFNAVGQIVNIPNVKTNNQILYKTNDLSKGIYFVNIRVGEQLIEVRFVKYWFSVDRNLDLLLDIIVFFNTNSFD